jgi:ornithine cyclodeaminase/alanine dehydrogenase-like protein (mu-crystallin family)
VTEEPRDAVEGMDVVISSVPLGALDKPFIDPAWVRPGTFVSVVDHGYSWLPGLGGFERIVTDDHTQAAHEIAIRPREFTGPYDTDITELLTGARPGRDSDEQRIVVAHGGHAIGILALAAHVYERARDLGLGTTWPINSI